MNTLGGGGGAGVGVGAGVQNAEFRNVATQGTRSHRHATKSVRAFFSATNIYN
jgi:hypothetical protein